VLAAALLQAQQNVLEVIDLKYRSVEQIVPMPTSFLQHEAMSGIRNGTCSWRCAAPSLPSCC
jgi:hypothetical protein